MIDWNPKPLPPEWMVELWAKLDNRWLNADTATVTGPWKVRSRGDAGGADDPIWIPYADGRPVSHEECVRRCLAAQEPPEGQEWIDQWTHAPASVTQRLADTGIVLPAADGGSWYRRHRPIAKPLPEPGDKAQPVDCRSPAGVAIGLIDGIIASCRVLRTMDLSDDEVREALEDVRQDEDVRAVCHPTHGGIPKSSSPTPKAPPAPPVGEWLGRAPTEEELLHHNRTLGSDGYGWWARAKGSGFVDYGGWTGTRPMLAAVDAAPARDEAHARELCEVRRQQHSTPTGLAGPAKREASAGPRITLVPESVVTLTDEDRRALDALAAKVGIPTLAGEEDAEASTAVGEATLAAVGEDIRPMIGQWIRDRDGDVFLLLAHVSDACDVYGSALAPNGDSACVELDGAEIITPPDPIPAPCHPVWEAFEALRRERSRTAAVTPEPPPGPAEGDVWAEIIAGLDESDPLRALAVERRQFGIDKYGTPLQRGNGRNHRADLLQEYLDAWAYAHALGDARETLYTAAAVRRLWGQLELKANPTTTNP